MLRICWMAADGPESLALLMDLVPVSSLHNEKGNQKTAELLKEFLGKTGLRKHLVRSTLTADHAIAGYIAEHLRKEGLIQLANCLAVCNSHNHQNEFKQTLERKSSAIRNGYTEGELKNL